MLNQPLKPILLASLAVLFSRPAMAGHEVGNGGNVIVCRDSSKVIRSVEILDYFEVREAGKKLRLNPSRGSYSAILKDLFQSWESVAPKRMAQYEKWLSEFENDSAIYSGGQIPPIDDTGVIYIPDGCDIEPAAFQRPDSQLLPGVMRYTINKDLWDHMPEIEKAGLVLHELVYREGIRVGQTSSFATRYFNGYLASATPDPMQYANVASQLPLEWVEFGHGLLIQIGTSAPFQRTSKITADGFVAEGNYNPPYSPYFGYYQPGTSAGIIGDVSSDHLKIRFKYLSPDAAEQSGQFEVTHERLHLEHLDKNSIDSLTTSIDGLQMEFNHLIPQLSSIDLFNQKNHLQIQTRAAVPQPKALDVNPASSFYIQADGSRIDSITKILATIPSVAVPTVSLYGDGFVTTSGDTWLYDSKIGKYVKK